MMRTQTLAGHTVTAFFIVLLVAMQGLASESSITLKPMAGQSGEFLVLDSAAVNAPVTLQSRVQIGSVDQISALQGMWLAGFSTAPTVPPRLLSVTWSQDTSGWFPSWSLRLQSNADLLPATLSPKSGSGFLEDSSYITLSSNTPQAGHVIETQLSYNPATGRLDVSVIDRTANAGICADSFMLNVYNGKLVPVLGIVGEGHGAQVQQYASAPNSVPLGVTWGLMTKEASEFQRLVLSRFTSGNNLALQIDADSLDLDGQFILVANNGTTSDVIVSLPAHARKEAIILPFSATQLPLGRFNLDFNYVDASNRVWNLGRQQLNIVAANLNIDFGPLYLRDNMLHGIVTLKSLDETMQNVPLQIYAKFAKPGDEGKAGEPQLIFQKLIEQVSTQPQGIAFTVPLNTDEQVFSLNLDSDFGKPVGKTVAGAQYYVLR